MDVSAIFPSAIVYLGGNIDRFGLRNQWTHPVNALPLAQSAPDRVTIVGEAVGDHATIVGIEDPAGIAAAIDEAVLRTSPSDRLRKAEAARAHALQFDRANVLDGILRRLWAARSASSLETAIGA